jgi:hypothetical protein
MTVNTPADVLGLMQRAQLRRQVGETKMNKQSSRSHCLFTLKVHSKKIVSSDGQVMECTGKLHLVDLAGSECAKTAGNDKVDPAKERERKNINQSLLTLGRVIRYKNHSICPKCCSIDLTLECLEIQSKLCLYVCCDCC